MLLHCAHAPSLHSRQAEARKQHAVLAELGAKTLALRERVAWMEANTEVMRSLITGQRALRRTGTAPRATALRRRAALGAFRQDDFQAFPGARDLPAVRTARKLAAYDHCGVGISTYTDIPLAGRPAYARSVAVSLRGTLAFFCTATKTLQLHSLRAAERRPSVELLHPDKKASFVAFFLDTLIVGSVGDAFFRVAHASTVFERAQFSAFERVACAPIRGTAAATSTTPWTGRLTYVSDGGELFCFDAFRRRAFAWGAGRGAAPLNGTAVLLPDVDSLHAMGRAGTYALARDGSFSRRIGFVRDGASSWLPADHAPGDLSQAALFYHGGHLSCGGQHGRIWKLSTPMRDAPVLVRLYKDVFLTFHAFHWSWATLRISVPSRPPESPPLPRNAQPTAAWCCQ